MKRSKIIAQPPKTIENPNIVHIKLAIIKHPKASQKLTWTIRWAKNVFEVVLPTLYIVKQKKWKFF